MSKDALPQSSQPTEINCGNKSKEMDTDFLTHIEDYLQQCQEQGEKVRLHSVDMKSLFLPSVETVGKRLGGRFSFVNTLSTVEDYSGVTLKMSRSGRYSLASRKGTTVVSASKFLSWLKVIAAPFFSSQSRQTMEYVTRASKVSSTAADWIMNVNSFESGFKFASVNLSHEFYPLFDYISKRCDADVCQREETKRQTDASYIDDKNLKSAWLQYMPLWSEHSLVSKARLSELTKVISRMTMDGQQVNKELMTDTDKLSYLRCYFALHFDFYFGAMASFEVGLKLFYTKDVEQMKAQKGILCRSLNAYVSEPQIKSCFGALLDELKDEVSQLVGSIGYRKMASFIPVEVDSSKEESHKLSQKQYDRLRSWRSGKDSPSDDLLNQFLDNLAGYAGKSNGAPIRMVCRIAISIDKEIKQLLKASKQDYANPADVEHELIQVLADYDRYYQACLNHYID
ncbi:hypothetical protein L2737_19655 [Shewanella electrodiphila]|uniref:Orphan protein n=1 Tax=Shewanella electrodiphila TaxID=934143 RepID=A0ABT0KUK0_9GAMM|nr:hypothetical protein [Shewanella electrodiphila]MCL1047521.1 hypothetical protein [Shewanella electrodiphila]